VLLQGPKRPPWWTDGKKKWNHGAPLSKKVKGTGCVRGPDGKWAAPAQGEQRDPQLPTSVPMPSAVADIMDAGMRAMWERDGEVEQEPLD
tara:strand:- start:335 stop:604 length:270 start_codon:yes stop_codon:yes gene_type:complete